MPISTDLLFPAAGAREVRERIGVVKASGRGFRTNLFNQDSEIARWVEAGNLSLLESEGAILLLRREPHYDRIYYAAVSDESVAGVLSRATCGEGRPLVSDLVGTRAEVVGAGRAFESAGFRQRACLQRLQCTPMEPIGSVDADPDVVTAQIEDAPEILQLLQSNFDVYSDQIPCIEEICRAIALGTILVVRGKQRIGGFYYYDRQGFTTLGRYWFVAPGFREHSMQLLYRYLQNCSDLRRFMVWVHEENRLVLNIYRLLGYKPDSIIDAIWMKQS